ncbi:unnamed protein product [Psylliodes chrysocephalus]|uniref:Uncharacterized protein n=1 Tax=Psylliodes chrysocephalus TaxID=3402493 RepID=A0A9P0D0F2_9CUCU|nr:unnamed protein product [Psylliodes chrysocephala]
METIKLRSPIKVECVSTFTKIDVLKNTKKLKGTNITISPDLTKTQQERNKIFRNHLRGIRQTTQDHCYMKGEKLYRNSTAYSVEDIIQIEESYNSIVIQQSNSAPQTPTRENNLSTFNQDNNKEIKELNDIEDKGAKTEKKEEKVAEHKEERKRINRKVNKYSKKIKKKKRKEERAIAQLLHANIPFHSEGKFLGIAHFDFINSRRNLLCRILTITLIVSTEFMALCWTLISSVNA